MSINYKNTDTQYGLVARLMHWSSVVLLFTIVIVSSQFEDLAASSEKTKLIILHYSIGLILLLVMLTRYRWRRININPVYSYNINPWQKVSASIMHYSIYLIVTTLSMSGLLMLLTGQQVIHFFNLVELAPLVPNLKAQSFLSSVHAFLSTAIYPLFAVHISVAIYHQIFGVRDHE